MVIKKIEILKFRGFENVQFDLGTQLTIIAGKNGTQKTTILGMLTQPFTISEKNHPLKEAKPMSGGSFKSAFNEKFKLSKSFDKAKSHQWTLHLHDDDKPFTVESILRAKDSEEIRFWKKGTRAKGSGYIQLPVIYLSLTRLMPIGEDIHLDESTAIKLTSAEEVFYKEWIKKILISLDDVQDANYLESPNKSTLGISTKNYDWRQNSAGQDNIGKILLAILSFKRLSEDHPTDYKGGILSIDELDAALYPGSQIKLVEALRKFSSNYNIQIIFTTHSLSILETVCELRELTQRKEATKNQIKLIYLEKKNNKINVLEDVSLNTIKHRLNVTIGGKKASKIPVFTEDKEAAIFAKALLKKMSSKLQFIDCSLSSSSLIDLPSRKVPSFIFPNALIFLDGDVRSESKTMTRIRSLKNIVVLPSSHSPERLLARYLSDLDDESVIWKKINPDFDKEYCFKNFSINEIEKDRDKAKKWFHSHLKEWGTNAVKVINPWSTANKVDSEKFIDDFKVAYNKFAKELAIDSL
jgi:predicted ATPase